MKAQYYWISLIGCVTLTSCGQPLPPKQPPEILPPPVTPNSPQVTPNRDES